MTFHQHMLPRVAMRRSLTKRHWPTPTQSQDGSLSCLDCGLTVVYPGSVTIAVGRGLIHTSLPYYCVHVKCFSIKWEEVPCSNCKDQTSTLYACLSIMHYICTKPMPLHLEAQPRNRDVKRKTPCTHVSLLILPEMTNRDSKLNDEEGTLI